MYWEYFNEGLRFYCVIFSAIITKFKLIQKINTMSDKELEGKWDQAKGKAKEEFGEIN
ncbi:hypothetical protein JCM19297_1842 [Nonlabens ulvanivorans]|nr:hypothetical protein JCM19297_1842 [Nonlabens ulvanivorans]